MRSIEEDEGQAEQAADEARQLDEAWKELVRSVLSNTRVDPKYKGKPLEFFMRYEDEVTPQQVAALQKSTYGESFKHFIKLWKELPAQGTFELSEAAEVFMSLPVATQCLYRDVKRIEKGDAPVDDLEILRKCSYLSTYFTSGKNSQFDVDDLGQQLNKYILLGIEWQHIDSAVIKMCVRRAAD